MNNYHIAETPQQIAALRLLTLKSALKLEIAGLSRRGKSAYSIVKSEFGFKGSKQAVFDQLVAHLKSIGYLAH